MFVGPVGSATAAELIPTLAERSLLTCSASATATSLTAGGSIDRFARTALRDDHLASIVADDMMAPADGSPAPATVMIVGRDDVYGNELIGALSAELTARGAAVDTIAYPARRVTFVDEAAAVAAAAPDAVVLVSYTEGPNLVNQLVAAGTPVDRILGLDGFFVPRLAEQVFPDDATRADGLTVIGTTGDRALMNRLAAGAGGPGPDVLRRPDVRLRDHAWRWPRSSPARRIRPPSARSCRASPPAGARARRSPTACSCSPPARSSTTTAPAGTSRSTPPATSRRPGSPRRG